MAYKNNSKSSNNNKNNSEESAKHSGAKFVKGRQGHNAGVEYISAWYFRKRSGLTTFIATTKGEVAKNDSLIYYVTVKSGFSKFLYTGFWHEKRRCLIIPELGFGIYPSGKNGGFCGFYSDMKRRS